MSEFLQILRDYVYPVFRVGMLTFVIVWAALVWGIILND